MTELTEQKDWKAIQTALAAPFSPDHVEWRPQGKPGPGKRVQLVPYVDAREVQERLDEVAGISGWSFTLEPLVVEGGELKVARGRLTLFGVSKDDVGTASTFEPSKGTASDALKRAAVMWGIGRYLYDLPAVWVTCDAQGAIPDDMLAKLREALRRRQTKISA